MNVEAIDFWARAKQSLETAGLLVLSDPDAAASRAYYAAFYAVSALFSLQEQSFSKHSALEAAVHRDLVKAGLWTKEQGSDYSSLSSLRTTGDYGGIMHVSPDNAKCAVEAAVRILDAASGASKNVLTMQ